jgi:hypothetical protein
MSPAGCRFRDAKAAAVIDVVPHSPAVVTTRLEAEDGASYSTPQPQGVSASIQ